MCLEWPCAFHFLSVLESTSELFSLHPLEFKRVRFAETSSPYGTIGLSVYYKPSITLPDRSVIDTSNHHTEYLYVSRRPSKIRRFCSTTNGPSSGNTVCLFCKKMSPALYCLRQSPRCWNLAKSEMKLCAFKDCSFTSISANLWPKSNGIKNPIPFLNPLWNWEHLCMWESTCVC